MKKRDENGLELASELRIPSFSPFSLPFGFTSFFFEPARWTGTPQATETHDPWHAEIFHTVPEKALVTMFSLWAPARLETERFPSAPCVAAQATPGLPH